MNTLSYAIEGEKRTDITFPSVVSECDGEQLTAVAAARLGLLSNEEKLRRIARIPDIVIEQLGSFQLFSIADSLGPVIAFAPSELLWKQWLFPTIEIDGETYYGPESSFGNVTWGEFIYADQCMIKGFHQAAISALFRPERQGWDGETDRRKPFSIAGTKHRFSLFGSMDGALATAIVWNYRAVRSASVDAAYPYLFPYFDPSAKKEDPEEENEEQDQKEQPAEFSWINVHRDILGENIQDEEKFLNLPMHTVLYRLNVMVGESKNRKKS